MNILIAGGTGFVGQHLTKLLVNFHHDVFILTRQQKDSQNEPSVHYIQWLNAGSNPAAELPQIDAAINLAGASLNGGRWTVQRKKKILESRLTSTNALISLIAEMPGQPGVLVNASAVGYYGTSKTSVFTETDETVNQDFLSDVTVQWESAALKAETLGVRTVLARFGIVLGKDEGSLPLMTLPYKLYLGGTIGNGDQWVSWIHIDDLCRLLLFAIEHQSIAGPLNITAPLPVTMKTFGQMIGSVMDKPHWFKVKPFILRALLGEMSDLILKGQKVIPQKASEAGFPFKFPNLKQALNDLLP